MLKLKLQYFGHLIRRTDIWKDPDAGKDWRWEEKGTTEDEMVEWHHQFSGHKSEQIPGDYEGQGSLAWQGSMQSMGSQSRTQLSNWTTKFYEYILVFLSFTKFLKYHKIIQPHLVQFITYLDVLCIITAQEREEEQSHSRGEKGSASHVWLFATPWTVACQACFCNSQEFRMEVKSILIRCIW